MAEPISIENKMIINLNLRDILGINKTTMVRIVNIKVTIKFILSMVIQLSIITLTFSLLWLKLQDVG